MHSSEEITLSRAVDSVLVPYGDTMPLPAGTKVRITQALGDTFTVVTDEGYMVRIAGKDADALGKEPPTAAPTGPVDTTVTKEDLEEQVWDQLRTCYDPEIPVNIVELGLVYECAVAEEQDGAHVNVKFTLTAPGCGMGDILRQDIERKVLSLPDVREADVQVQLDPPWDQTRMSDAARLQLGLM